MATRMLESIAKFPFDAPMRHPKISQTRLYRWIFNDAIPYYVWENNLDLSMGPQVHSMNQYWFPIAWFDPTWALCVKDHYV